MYLYVLSFRPFFGGATIPVGGAPAEVEAFLKEETAPWRHAIVSGCIKRQ